MKDSISTVVSRRTLQTGKECSAYLFSKVTMNNIKYNNQLQGFTISNAYVTSMTEAEELVKDLDDIFINLVTSREGSEILFVKATKEAMNAWYQMSFDGGIATKVCEKFNYFKGDYDQDAVKPFKQKLIDATIHSDLIQI